MSNKKEDLSAATVGMGRRRFINTAALAGLTVVSVLVLPINIISGLFGMNVGGIPLAEAHDGFWIVVALVASLTLAAAWVAFRDRD